MVKPRYDGTELRKAIEAVVGADTLIGDAKTRLLVPTVNMTKGSVQLFKTAHHPNFINDYKVKAIDVAMATSAAPTFFPMAKIGASYFVDGGVVANTPDLCAIHEATHFLGIEIDDIRVLSIGTITTGFSLPTSLGGNFGASSWMKNQRLISMIFSSQQQLVDVMARHRLGGRHLRMDDKPGLEQSSDLGLDIASKKRRETLLGMADGVHQQFGGSAEILAMLDHQPIRPTFYKHRKPLP
ncbi:CBASS cGAMP-activated phospholipase [Mesorhizobium sp.]|uniref:CBASS cGAMP-activated phospholipase n=1 Tax=Mesorhizobium sp. TaxID=1871066 RepID=UPI00247983C4|nr:MULTISPECIES: CBASS cGAMP-activated phospholipase [unclassified Mesorhizobium]